MTFWQKLNPFKKEVVHCHVPLVAGHATTMDTMGGVVTGMVEHPENDKLFIEFAGVVVDSSIEDDLFDQYLDAIEAVERVLDEKVKEIQSKSEVAEDNQLLVSFDPKTDIFMEMGGDHSFSFWEDDSARITAYGHRNKKEFAKEVQAYDIYCGESDLLHDEDDITHRWGLATVKHGELCITPCNQYHPKGFPITTIWSAR